MLTVLVFTWGFGGSFHSFLCPFVLPFFFLFILSEACTFHEGVFFFYSLSR